MSHHLVRDQKLKTEFQVLASALAGRGRYRGGYHTQLGKTIRTFAQTMPDDNPFKYYMLQCGVAQPEGRKTAQEAYASMDAERKKAHVKKGFIKGCVAGVVLSAVGVIVALSLQTAKIITMNQIAVAGLNVGIGALNVLGASIGSVSTLGTAGTVAAFAGGIAFSMISIGVVLLVKRAVDRSPSSFRGSSQEEPIVVQASKDNFPASSLVTGGGSSAVRLIDENRRAHQETSNRPRQAGSSAGVQGAL